MFTIGSFVIDLINFKTLNDYHLKTTCLIKLKLIGSTEQASKSLYISFQVIQNFYKMLECLILVAIGTSYGLASIQIY